MSYMDRDGGYSGGNRIATALDAQEMIECDHCGNENSRTDEPY